ncbi:hypothetical protein Moror_6701 [Moniliophthora roreri MCA 2997]|uniref:DUF6534 domain-containing protein n=1 Tax=Moniliophthora roreri (strain MCA 2997) TaxID=1381753 RepID=V2XV50_MONRO|nr:hypothetical protein Moror_6701 [Moniliophthora roreri MCA 2997]
MASAVELPPGFIERTYSAELMPTFASTALWGIQFSQTLYYFQSYPNDHWLLKSLVAWTWIMDTVHQALLITLSYRLLIVHFGDPTSIFKVNTELITSILFGALVSAPIQLFFVYRIFVLSERKIIFPAIVVLCIVTETVAACLFVGYSFLPSTSLNQLLNPGNFGADIGLTMMIAAACADIIIATSMVYLLRKTMVGGMTQTQRMISRLTIYSVNTGLWTALLAFFVVAIMIAYPGTFLAIGIYIPLTGLYCNTLLANLNVRQHVRKSMENVITFPSLPMTPRVTIRADEGNEYSDRDPDPFAARLTVSTTNQHEHSGQGKAHEV